MNGTERREGVLRLRSLLKTILIAGSLCWLLFNSVGRAQEQNASIERHTEAAQSVSKEPISEVETKSPGNTNSTSRGSFIVAPMPISSPALGTGIVPVVGYIFPFRKSDTVSPPSVVGVAGLITNNGSRGFAAYADLFMQ